MNAVGIDVSKGKSMIAVMRPFGEIVARPFEVRHTSDELKGLVDFLKGLDGEVRIIMEFTGRYYQPIARCLFEPDFLSVLSTLSLYMTSETTRSARSKPIEQML